ncbi:MAG: hypothetical protein V1870_01670, partial [Candidatus Aenigmatarchaeota archaeon]
TVKLLENFRQLGLVSFDKIGRVKYIKLTYDGEELASYFENVLRKFTKMIVKTVPEIEKPTPIAKNIKPIPVIQKQVKPLIK